MPELKRNFTQGKMNKDLDERLLPSGEYRDANNIQVSTSEGSDIGAVQTTLGNTLKSATGTSTPPWSMSCSSSAVQPLRNINKTTTKS